MRIDSSKKPKVVTYFFDVLDETEAKSLTTEQYDAIEEALLTVCTLSHHKVDLRKSFSFFGKRFYWVFLFGRDHRRVIRHENRCVALLLTLAAFSTGFIAFASAVLTLYLIKSALGINIFPHYSFGIWDWFQHLWA